MKKDQWKISKKFMIGLVVFLIILAAVFLYIFTVGPHMFDDLG